MKFSIITPSYNQAAFIERTIKSIIGQTGSFELEYIIIDGQSTDSSVNIIKRYAEQDKRIKWLSEKDRGQSDAINKGLKMATGDIVAYLNSDDIYLSDTLEKVHNYFQNNPTKQWLYGQCKIINEQDQEISHLITKYKNFFLKHYNYNTLLILNYISQPACFWRKTAMNEVGLFSEKQHLVMDYEYWLKLGKLYDAGVINNYLSGFRSYQNNKSSLRFKQQFKEEYEVACKFTQSIFLRLVHWLHYHAIILVYSSLR